MGRTSIKNVRTKDVQTLEADLVNLKEQLWKARIDVQLKDSRANLKSICYIRKSIARSLLAISEKNREALKKRIVEEKIKPSDIPRHLRPKLTRALRRRLTPRQENKKLRKVYRKQAACKLRNYAVLA